METRQLRYFVAVAEELHFGNAARRLNISQPPLSQQIKKFEDQLGVVLFTRSKRSVSLTAAGRALLEEARIILDRIQKAEQNLRAVHCGEGGTLRLGYIGPALETALTHIIRSYKAAYPGVRFSLNRMFTNDQLEAVRKGAVDAGVVRLFRHDVDDLECILFHRESYALIIPKGHGFSHREQVDISELEKEPLIFFPRSRQPRLYDEWMKAFSDANVLPGITQEAETKTEALALVAAGLGISIVPENMARRNQPDVMFKLLTGNYPSLEMHIVSKKIQNSRPWIIF